MRTPDTSHLTPEDAELATALYLERNRGITRAELDRVRLAAEAGRAPSTRHARHAA